MNKEKLATAYHEAGHVVACIYFNIPIKKVSIIAYEDTFGRVTHSGNAKLFKALENGELTAMMERYFKQMMIMCLAGPIAEAKYRRQDNWDGCGYQSDLAQVSGLLLRMFGSENVWNAYVKYISEETKDLFECYKDFEENKGIGPLWKYVEQLATILMERGSVSGKDCVGLYRNILGGTSSKYGYQPPHSSNPNSDIRSSRDSGYNFFQP